LIQVKPRSQTCCAGAVLGLEKFVTVLDRPAAERFHRALHQALPQAGQVVVDPRRRLGMRVALDQSACQQTAQGVGQNLVADATDRGAQLATSARSHTKGRQHYGIPGMGEEIGGRA
jgi:hypothetical protein